jgi:hypothetical protein
MVAIRKRFFHVRQNLKRFRAYWQRRIYNKSWKIYRREKERKIILKFKSKR